MLLSLTIIFAVAAAFGLYLWSGAKQELERTRKQAAGLEGKRVNNDSELRQKESEIRQLREDLQMAKSDLKAQKKKNFENKQVRPQDNTSEVEIAQLKTELAQWQAAAEQARLDLQNARPHAAPAPIATKVEAPVVIDTTANDTERAALEKRIAELSRRCEELTIGLQGEKQRVGAEAKAILEMRRKVEWHRRIHLVQRGEAEKVEDKLGHLRARYLELCGDYVRISKMVPQAAEKLHAQVLSPEGQREVAALQQEQSVYIRSQEKADAAAAKSQEKAEPAAAKSQEKSETAAPQSPQA